MAKKPVKKTITKKTTKSAGKVPVRLSAETNLKAGKAGKTTAKPVKKTAKKATSKGIVKKPSIRKPLTDKQLDQRAANVIANSEKKNVQKKSKRPKKTSTSKETSSLLDAIVEGMQEKKAKNIMILNLSAIENRVADYFVICDADSKTHVESIAGGVEDEVIKLTSEKPYHSEGQQNSEWILVDYINIVAHVFLREFRELYNLEALWGDAEITLINN